MYKCIYLCTCSYTYIHRLGLRCLCGAHAAGWCCIPVPPRKTHIYYVYVNMYIYIYICTDVYIYIYIYVDIHTYT